MTLVTDFFFLSPFTCYLLFVYWSCEGRNGGKSDKDSFKHDFYFRGLRLFCGVERFPVLEEITVLPYRGVRRTSGIILANCESLLLSIGSLRVHHVCLLSVGVFSRRGYEQEKSRTTRPEALEGTCAPTGSQEKKESSVLVEEVK